MECHHQLVEQPSRVRWRNWMITGLDMNITPTGATDLTQLRVHGRCDSLGAGSDRPSLPDKSVSETVHSQHRHYRISEDFQPTPETCYKLFATAWAEFAHRQKV